MPGDGAVLAPDGLGVVKFGEATDAALATLRARFGAPRELPSECRDIARVLEWDALVAYFGPTFVGYHYLTEGGPPLRTEAGIGKGSTVGQLKAAYATKLAFGEGPADGPLFEITLPAGVLGGYAGGPADTDTVETFFAGTTCGE
jgi:hypothetical protein